MNDEEVKYFKDVCFNPAFVDVENKESIARYHAQMMLQRTFSMFDYSGDIDKIETSKRYAELTIQTKGYAGLIDWKNKFYIVYGNLGGEKNFEYFPKKFIVANPWLDCFKEFDVGENVAIIPNDPLYLGLTPIFTYYSSQLAENVISKLLVTINTRAFNAFAAKDEKTKASIEEFLKGLKDGKLKTILTKNILDDDSVISLPYASNATAQPITQLIEDQQYIKASFFNELGLQANYNMKRESINSNEAQLNQDALIPFVDSMLFMRQKGLEDAKRIFGLDITVELGSVWKAVNYAVKLPPQEDSNQLDNEEESNQLENNDNGGDDSEKNDSNSDK